MVELTSKIRGVSLPGIGGQFGPEYALSTSEIDSNCLNIALEHIEQVNPVARSSIFDICALLIVALIKSIIVSNTLFLLNLLFSILFILIILHK